MAWAAPRAGFDVVREQRDVVGAIALPLRQAAAETALIARAADEGLGVVLAGQAHLNQLPVAARGRGFAALPFAQPYPLHVERTRMSATALADYAEAFLDAQLSAGATLATTPAHVCDAELSYGREQDLGLAHATIAAWHERQAWRPPPQRPDAPPRELFAGIAVRGRGLVAGSARGDAAARDGVGGAAARDGVAGAPAGGGAGGAVARGRAGGDVVDRLIELYAPLDVSGYWLTVFDADGSGAQLGAVAELALGLQHATGRPVTVSGIASLHEALLASGVAATCAGGGAAGASFPPKAIDGDEVTGIAVEVFHPAILGTVPPGPHAADALEWLFVRHPCRCGEHPLHEPPRRRRAALRHNAWQLAAEARDATRLVPIIDEQRLAARIGRANAIRRQLALAPLQPGWAAVAAAARTRRAAAADTAMRLDA
ncbi:hypothetical protein [Conexibacter sp. CPCC 206217]|uniref:hypothetical protein n=1 Tax=Conexibacter sp. CPCC 206217 TaxID=3064574 RepID=UPI002716D410|nr:hypothetical protein [Conexibacter sp. CPCC 206217]MDO8212385.1 hypothetical protein [Conexibacter sp. CPCC 206217]